MTLRTSAPEERFLDASGNVCALARRRGGDFIIEVPDVGLFEVCADGSFRTVSRVADAADAEIGRALDRIVRPLALQLGGAEILHASAVSRGDRVLVLVGLSQAGKSTLAAALAASNRGWVGRADDHVCLRFESGLPMQEVLSFAPELRPASATWLASQPAFRLSGLSTATSDAPLLPVGGVLLLRPSGSGERTSLSIEPVLPGQAFGEVFVHAHVLSLENPARKRALVEHFLHFAETVPTARMARPEGLDHVPAIIEAIETWFDEVAGQVTGPANGQASLSPQVAP